MLTTKQIDYILELAQTRNFNRAAEKLYISQPTLTYQIKCAEDEVGFEIFERSGKGAALTPAGEQFCVTLRDIKSRLHDAIEQGQNFSVQYAEDIQIGLPTRSCLYFLPQVMREFSTICPETLITPSFINFGDATKFLTDQHDLLFTMAHEVAAVPNIKVTSLYESRIYLIVNPDDPLASKDIIKPEDLVDRTLMIGGGSPPKLKRIQQYLISHYPLDYFNSADHETTLINVAAGKGVCLAPGFLNEHTEEFTWIPFDTDERISCVLCSHKNDKRDSLRILIQMLKESYLVHPKFPC